MKRIIILLFIMLLTSVIVTSTPLLKRLNDNILMPFGNAEELVSPSDRIKESQIKIYNDKVVIEIENAQWASFLDTNSMDPIIDEGANAIQITPESHEEIYEGDIISYKSEYAEGIFIHRVIETGFDNNGWYCIAKGDNNPEADPGKIRFSQVKKVLIAIIY